MTNHNISSACYHDRNIYARKKDSAQHIGSGTEEKRVSGVGIRNTGAWSMVVQYVLVVGAPEKLRACLLVLVLVIVIVPRHRWFDDE